MHVVDAGPGCEVDDNMWCHVRMECERCELATEWFQVRTVTEAKKGIPCPKCEGRVYATNEYGEYVPTGGSNDHGSS